MFVRRAVLAATALVVAQGCAASTTRFGDPGFCAPPSRVLVSFEADPPPPKDAPSEERIAALLGLRAQLAEARSGARSAESRTRALERIELARLAIGSTAAELDCESERAEQAAAYLAARDDRTQDVLTISSIVIGAATGVASAALSNGPSNVQVGVAIAGGATGAGLGIASLWVNPTLEFEHPRNLLTDVWSGPATSTMYPPIVWAYLTSPEFPTAGGPSIRANVVRRWREFRTLDGNAQLFFGAGGKYNADDLRARAAMLDQVRTEVLLLNQEVAAFSTKLLRD